MASFSDLEEKKEENKKGTRRKVRVVMVAAKKAGWVGWGVKEWCKKAEEDEE